MMEIFWSGGRSSKPKKRKCAEDSGKEMKRHKAEAETIRAVLTRSSNMIFTCLVAEKQKFHAAHPQTCTRMLCCMFEVLIWRFHLPKGRPTMNWITSSWMHCWKVLTPEFLALCMFLSWAGFSVRTCMHFALAELRLTVQDMLCQWGSYSLACGNQMVAKC